jgi:sec-independent protein translocase protein TatA
METNLLFMPSGYEIAVILVIVLLLFGGKKIPELMRGLGKGMKEFKNATSEVEEVKKELSQTARTVDQATKDKQDKTGDTSQESAKEK